MLQLPVLKLTKILTIQSSASTSRTLHNIITAIIKTPFKV